MIIFFKICYVDFILLLLRNKIIINVNYLYGLILFNLCLREVKMVVVLYLNILN